MRPAPLPEVAGPQAAVTVGYVAAVAPSLAVVPVSDLLHDDATVQFLLQQSLLVRAQEEEEARELEEVKRMEEAVVTKMQRLEAEVQMYAGQDLSLLSDFERAAVTLVARSDALRRRRERRRKRKKQRKKKLPPCSSSSLSTSLCSSTTSSSSPVLQLRRRDRYPQCICSCSLCSSWTRFLTCLLWFFDRCLVRWCRKLWFARSCRPSLVVDILFVPLRQIPMVQTVQQTTEIPQLPFVLRWSMPLLCRSCGSTGCTSPCTAQCLVRPWIQILRQFTEIFTFFYVKRWITDPEVDSRPALCPRLQRTAWFDLGYKFCVSLRRISRFFYVNWWITDPEVDSQLSGHVFFALEMWTLFYCPLYLVVTCSLCGGESFSPDDAYVSALDSVMPMKGKHTINYLQYHEYGSGRPSLEWEVQWDFRVHSSSCGALCGVVHSPFEWFYHRCHCNYRDLVLFVGRLPCCRSVCVAMSCGGGFFSPGCAYDSVWDSVKPIAGKYFFNYFQYQDVVGCVAMSCGGDSFSPYGAYDFAWDSVKPTKGTYTINFIQHP